ncbi:MAG: riboflavin kinase, partial [Candidatus Desantisbacteria bacterium]
LDGIGNLGRRPTFSEDKLILEVHIFGFSGNLYGKNLSIQFLDRIRGEIKFSSKEDLSAQIKKDIEGWKITVQYEKN